MTARRLVPLALVAAALSIASASALAETKPKPVATCVSFWAEVRARAYGYDHFVHLESACKKPATCAVSSDVNPDAQTVTLAPGESIEVATFLGSPAATFVPKVACTLP
jgi:hypothetical protein